jgi:hypothetical protein
MTTRTALRFGALLIGLALATTTARAQADPGFLPVAGTWTRGGVDTVAWFDLASWRLITSIEGAPPVAAEDPSPQPWRPVVGDWNGDGIDSIQMFNVRDWRLVPAENGPLAASGDPQPDPWRPVAGDWDGDGIDTVLVFDVRNQSLRRLDEGPIPVERYDPSPNPWIPAAGDWDGDRIDTLSIHRNKATTPATAGVWALVAGDWDGDGIDTAASFHMPSGQLVALDEELHSAAARSAELRSPASVSDELSTGPGACFKTKKNLHTSVHKFYYRAGGCMAIVLTTWEEWSCCPFTADGLHYGCSKQLKIDSYITGC